ILRTLPRVEGNPYVFAAPWANKYLNSWDRYKKKLDARLPTTMRPWRHHDLRRTARTLMSRITKKVPPEIPERVLAHTIGIVEGTYDVYPYLDEKSEALFHLAALLDEILHSPSATQNTMLARDAMVNITVPTVRKTHWKRRRMQPHQKYVISPKWNNVMN